MNNESERVEHRPAGIGKETPVEQAPQTKEKLLLEGLSQINARIQVTAEDKFARMIEKVRLYADLGFTEESRHILEEAETHQMSMGAHVEENTKNELKNPSDILNSPL